MSTSAGSAGHDHPQPVRSADGAHRDPTRTADDTYVQDRRGTVVEREKEEHGGVKIGSAFFGFLTAVGVGVLLTALLTAAGTAVGVATNTDAGDVTSAATNSASTVGIVGGILLLVIVFIAYYCGGYVASRMARFNGAKQGFAVWLWALVIAIVVAVLGTVGGSQYNVLSQLNSFPRIPVSEGDLTTGGIIALVALLAASLLGAVLGGLAGMRFHRRVDETGLGR
jgi:amino acid transporter